MVSVVVPGAIMPGRVAQYLTGGNLTVVWAEFSTLNRAFLIRNKS